MGTKNTKEAATQESPKPTVSATLKAPPSKDPFDMYRKNAFQTSNNGPFFKSVSLAALGIFCGLGAFWRDYMDPNTRFWADFQHRAWDNLTIDRRALTWLEQAYQDFVNDNRKYGKVVLFNRASVTMQIYTTLIGVFVGGLMGAARLGFLKQLKTHRALTIAYTASFGGLIGRFIPSEMLLRLNNSIMRNEANAAFLQYLKDRAEEQKRIDDLKAQISQMELHEAAQQGVPKPDTAPLKSKPRYN